MFNAFIELLKTPAISALIAAITAILSAPLTQRLNRRATELQWLREQRGRAYVEFLAAFDRMAIMHVRLDTNPSEQDREDFKAASDEFTKARVTIALYAPPSVTKLLSDADNVTILSAGTRDWHRNSAIALADIRLQIIKIARQHIGSGT